jgi:methionyl-tRNA formyltransferase
MTILGRLRVLFFGSGSPASLIALNALAQSASVVGVVVPMRPGFFQRDPASALMQLAASLRLPTYRFNAKRQDKLVDTLERENVRPDLIGVGTFPSILRREVLNLAPSGGVNLHWSMLPRHRGPDPLFWTYMNDDRTTGVTVHWLDELADAGPIVLQREIPLVRGRHFVELYRELASIGGELLSNATSLIEAGKAPRVAQDEKSATSEPSRARGMWRVDPERWSAERVWHVVKGLTIRRDSLLKTADGRPLVHGTARSYSLADHDRAPGTIEGMRVFCPDGFVDLESPA